MKRKIFTVFLLLIELFAVAACSDKISTNYEPKIDLNELQILRTDLKLTQEQTLSRIKAEYLKKNNGYKDSDEIIAILKLENESLIDTYLDKYSDDASSVSEYAKSNIGIAQNNKILAKQNKLIEELTTKGLIKGVECQYTTILNGIAVKTTYGNFKKLSKVDGITNAMLSDTYNMPMATKASGNAVENVVEVYETGIFDSSSVSYTGNNTSVAVLDSGFDCSHSVFANQPERPMFTKDDINEVLAQTKAAENTPDVKITDVYYSSKIPFIYDYADKDTDVFPYDSEHGTHVAGIIGGKDDVITGVAVNTQLVLMKVFPDLDEGAHTEDILLALEDATVIGVDAINMSLGSSCGFSREVDEVEINRVYDALDASGISVITAASNSYSSGFGGAQGNTNLVTNPDSATVGSPSTYDACLSVASISGVKSKYMFANDKDIIFFDESNDITGKENDFFKELGITEGESKTYEYVTIPGVGLKVNFNSVGDLSGKIALVRRGDITFEEKAQNAKNAGAAACIIYNNIDGEILMSMGKTGHIPTISISKDNGTILAAKDKGTLTISYNNQAGPFMSDFSSWGPNPNLGLKPEITAHGGNIKSAIPGGGYDELSGTSMATPNLCGIVVLIRQYIKDNYPQFTGKSLSIFANQLLMSTATIALDENGNPYSPRKQGAGLASLKKAVNTKAYLTVDGSDRTKLELGDDAKRTGVYTMTFNVVNLSNTTVEYDIDTIGMTESVSTSDDKHVSEKAQILTGKQAVKLVNGTATTKLSGTTLTVGSEETAKIEVVYTLTNEDKNLIDKLFPYGMYVEGFVTLTAKESDDVDLNIPFLAFYGDWTEAPMFDKTYYEVDPEEKDASINDEDKLKADYYATTPYGSYFYNYIIPLGTYLYDVDESAYDVIPAREDHIAISNTHGAIDGLANVYAGLLRGAKQMDFEIRDKVTGEVVWKDVDYNCIKAFSQGGSPIPYYHNLNISTYQLGLVNNRQYEFSMKGVLDYGDGGISNNARNSFSFDFTFDEEAPVIKKVTYEKEYDKIEKKDRYYMTMVVYDNHYVQSISPIIFNSSSSYTTLTANPIPVYSEKGADNSVRFEITEFLDDLYEDNLVTSALGFAIDDYALNSNIYLCELPGTNGDFKFTDDGTWEATTKLVINVDEGEVVDLTKYLATSDPNVDADRDYLNHLVWESKDESIAKVKEGIVVGVKKGRVTVSATEMMYSGRNAVIVVNVREKAVSNEVKRDVVRRAETKQTVEETEIESLRFSYFDTIAAFARSAQTSVIGETGSRVFLSNVPDLNFYPGEKIQLHYDFNPWYAESNYNLSFHSSNEKVATVDPVTGVVEGQSKGTTWITLRVEGSTIQARIRVTINDPFIIENRMLVAYKGKGGDVVIPDDEGILYIGAFAFCLYITDRNIKVDEDDWDKNKIPQANTTIESVVIPEGVEDIQKYAFYNCKNLKSVTIPDSVKFIREFAFDGNENLETININKTQTIGRAAFRNCKKLNNIDLSKVFAIGVSAFEGCASLDTADLTALRNTGERAFKDCITLRTVTMNENTKLAKAMFVNTALETVDIYEKIQIPDFCFAKCSKLVTVNIHNSLVSINEGAFSECPRLVNFNIEGSVDTFGNQVFYASTGLTRFVLPDCDVILGNYLFRQCTNLETLVFGANTHIIDIYGVLFQETKLTNFEVNQENPYYTVDGIYLTNPEKTEIIFAPIGTISGDVVLDAKYTTIGASAFGGADIDSFTINSEQTVEIKKYAFVNSTINKLNISGIVTIGNHAFYQTESLTTVVGTLNNIGEYAFAYSGIKNIEISEIATVKEGAFYTSKVEKATIGSGSNIGDGAFQNCAALAEVAILGEGTVHFGAGCFGYCTKLAKIDLSKVDNIIEDETFFGCTALTEANLANVKYIGAYAFADCSNLLTISVPKVIEIGEGAFSKNSETGYAPKFARIELPETLEKLGAGAFLGCEGLIEIIIPEKVNIINEFTFAYCINLMEATLSSNITRLEQYAFAGCQKLDTINLENITYFGDYALGGTVALRDANIANGEYFGQCAFLNSAINIDLVLDHVTYIGVYAFQNAGIKSFSSTSIETIDFGAFEFCANLERISLSDKIISIDALAFDECPLVEKYLVNGEENAQINEYGFVENGILYHNLPNGAYELKAVPGNLNVETLEIKEGTTRIDDFAGNQNKFVKTIVLPDSLKLIGNYAFYDYDNLTTVEFKSVKAPALEDNYNSELALEEGDPGYDLAHKYMDLFDLELYYCTFINLAGKHDPIAMVIPVNADETSYGSIVYELFFGKVENATRSTYTAKEQALKDFIEYAKEIVKIEKVTLSDERIVENAMNSYSTIKQNPVDFGINEADWNNMVDKVTTAYNQIRTMKLSKAPQKVKDLQALIDSLPAVPEVHTIESLKPLLASKEVTTKIGTDLNKLKSYERELIDASKYNELVTAYSIYDELVANQEPTPGTDPVTPTKPDKKGCKCSCGAAIGFIVTIMMASSVIVIIRRKND